jgi:hypothetical protein
MYVCDELMTPFKQQRDVARHHHPHARPAFALSWDMTPLFSRERRSFHRKSCFVRKEQLLWMKWRRFSIYLAVNFNVFECFGVTHLIVDLFSQEIIGVLNDSSDAREVNFQATLGHPAIEIFSIQNPRVKFYYIFANCPWHCVFTVLIKQRWGVEKTSITKVWQSEAKAQGTFNH